MQSKSKIWYSFIGGDFKEHDFGFYENDNLAWVNTLEDNVSLFQEEINAYIEDNNNEIKPYFNESLVTKKKSWKTFAFFFWTWRVTKNIKQCPKTNETLRQIPNIISASVSILEPGLTIKPHRGDTNAIIRCHLPLIVPKGLPECGLEVAGEKRPWELGKVLAFNDAAKHSAWNHSDKRRIVLLIDVLRPGYQHKKYTVCSMVLGGLVMQFLFQKVPFFKNLPIFFKAILLKVNAFFINLILRVSTLI